MTIFGHRTLRVTHLKFEGCITDTYQCHVLPRKLEHSVSSWIWVCSGTNAEACRLLTSGHVLNTTITGLHDSLYRHRHLASS
jgi:hypothetical protein